MKTLLLLLLSIGSMHGQVLLLNASIGEANLVGITNAGGGGCTTLSDHVDGNYLQIISSQHYIAGYIDTPTSSETICRIDANASSQSFGGTVTLEVWTFDSGTGTPGTFITGSDPVNESAMPNSPTPDWVTFTFSTPWSKVAGNNYVLVLHCSDTAQIDWQTGNIGDPGHHTAWSSLDGSTWTVRDISNLDRVWMREYK